MLIFGNGKATNGKFLEAPILKTFLAIIYLKRAGNEIFVAYLVHSMHADAFVPCVTSTPTVMALLCTVNGHLSLLLGISPTSALSVTERRNAIVDRISIRWLECQSIGGIC